MDDLHREFGAHASRGGEEEGVWEVDPGVRAAGGEDAAQRGLGGLVIEALEVFGVDLKRKTAIGLSQWFERRQLQGNAPGLYRVGLEGILGFTRRGNSLTLTPRVPADWAEFAIEYRFGGSTWRITVRQPGRIDAEGARVTVDGQGQEWPVIQLVDDGRQHEVVVEAGSGER